MVILVWWPIATDKTIHDILDKALMKGKSKNLIEKNEKTKKRKTMII